MDEILILKQVLTQGPFAALFVWLLWSTKREARERETRLMEHVDKMAVQFEKHTFSPGECTENMPGNQHR
jgi:hypothetical protein